MALSRRRRPSLSREVTAQLRLGGGERTLAWASTADGHVVAGSERAIYLPVGPADGEMSQRAESAYRRLSWEDVERADWQRDSSTLAVVEVAGWGLPERRTTFELDEPGQLLELLRERVTKSVLITVYAPVRGRRGVSVVGRRSPTGEGVVTWSYVLATGLDPDDPDVVEVAERTLAEAQNELAGL